jgi:hypothetical protein
MKPRRLKFCGICDEAINHGCWCVNCTLHMLASNFAGALWGSLLAWALSAWVK